MIKLIKKNIKTITLILVVCLCIYLADDYYKNKENYTNECKNAKFIFLHVDGCIHCEKLKEIWNPNGKAREFQQNIKNDPDLKKKVNLKAYKDDDPEHKKRLNHVEKNGGYPTLILEKCDNTTKLYQGDRSSKSMSQWLNKQLN